MERLATSRPPWFTALCVAAAIGVGAACVFARAATEPGAAADAAAAPLRSARLADSDTLLSLTNEGAILYAQDKLRLSGYQYCSQALALAEAGEFRQSVRAASKALYLGDVTRDPNLLALARRDLAIVYSYAGQLDKAEEFARDALEQPARDPQQVVGPAYKVLGDVYSRRGNYARAVDAYEKALAGSSPRYAPLVQSSLVNALIDAGDVAHARELLAGLREPSEAPLAAQLERTRARLLLAEGRPAEARDLYRSLTAQQVGADSGYYQLWAWDGVARSELALGQRQAAADAAGRALGIVDAVRARFRSEEFKMGLFSDLQSVFDRAIGIFSDLGDARDAFEISERSRSRALLDAVRGRGPLSDETVASVDLATLQRTLAADERVVQFHALANRLQAWVVGPDGIVAHTLPIPRDELNRRVAAFRDSVTRGSGVALEQASQLGSALLAPLGLAPAQRVVIVPHGPLHYLPFQALRLDGRYLIETNPVAVAPSTSIAVQLARRSPRAEPLLTAFGNPRIADEYDLPGAEREVRQLARLFADSRVYLGSDATETRFREVAPAAPLIHVAAHAQADPVDPLYSRILLADEGGRHNFLEAREILNLPLQHTALVTLSACESALGRIASGDEVLGFTRSFLSAGASSLISSLWPVSDDATEILMTTLYAELAKGRDVQQAMQAAQLAVLHSPRMSHPLFWAPFNLIGNWRLKLENPA